MSTNNIITTDLQNLEVDSGLIELFDLVLSESVTLHFHPGLDTTLTDVSYDGNTYIALPMTMEGMAIASDGASNRPTLTVANVTTLFKSALNGEGFSFDDLIGKKITRRQTLIKYLDDAAYELPRTSYLIDRIAAENSLMVSFELAAPYDVSGIRIPNRVIVGKYCAWVYQGLDALKPTGGCNWRGTNSIDRNGVQYFAYFDSDDRPLIDSSAGVTTAPFVEGTYTINTFVSHNGLYWRSEVSDNSTTPSASVLLWKQVFFWGNWNAAPGSPYAVGSYVKHSNKIWKCLLSTSSVEPVPGSLYWVRVDVCGKTLNSCKSRFQFTPISGSTVVSATKDTSVTLPFGAFPGSVKFK